MILVTGGTGLLGSHLLYELVSSGKAVTAIRRSEKNMPEVLKVFSYYSDSPEILLEKIRWVKADMLNYLEVMEVMNGIKEVYHCAAIVSFDPSRRNEMIHSNVKGTANLVNAAIENKIRRFIHVSSTAAIGRPPEGKMADESMILREPKSRTAYSLSKFQSEMEVWRAMEEGLNAAIVNPSIILGPGFWEQGSSSIFTNIAKGLKFHTSGITGYVGVWDVIGSMTRLMESDLSGERFIVTSENYSYKELFIKVADALGVKRPFREGTVFLTELAWRFDWIKSKLFRLGAHIYTRERIRSSHKKTEFSNNKICEQLDMKFEDIDGVVGKVAEFYKSTELTVK